MMAKRTEDTDAPADAGGSSDGLPRMLTLDQVKEVLNVNTPAGVCAGAQRGTAGRAVRRPERLARPGR